MPEDIQIGKPTQVAGRVFIPVDHSDSLARAARKARKVKRDLRAPNVDIAIVEMPVKPRHGKSSKKHASVVMMDRAQLREASRRWKPIRSHITTHRRTRIPR